MPTRKRPPTLPAVTAERITWRDRRIPPGGIGIVLSAPSEHTESGVASCTLHLASLDDLSDEHVNAAARVLAQQDTERLPEYETAIRAAVEQLRAGSGKA